MKKEWCETKEWEFENNSISEDGKCPYLVEPEEKIIISDKALTKIIKLNKLGNEWLGITTIKQEGNIYTIEDIFIPEQLVTSSSCKVTEKGRDEFQEFLKSNKSQLGWIHSHSELDTFFSNTDILTNKMFPLSIVVNNDMKIEAQIKKLLPCGKKTLLDIPEDNIEFENFEYNNKIKQEPITYNYYDYYGKYYGYTKREDKDFNLTKRERKIIKKFLKLKGIKYKNIKYYNNKIEVEVEEGTLVIPCDIELYDLYSAEEIFKDLEENFNSINTTKENNKYNEDIKDIINNKDIKNNENIKYINNTNINENIKNNKNTNNNENNKDIKNNKNKNNGNTQNNGNIKRIKEKFSYLF